MPTLPHDLADLSLAPLVLHLDEQLASYDGLSTEQIGLRLAVETNSEPRSGPARKERMLEALTRFVDMHGWEVCWTTRGLRLSNHTHSVTLGAPPTLATFLELR